MTKFSVIIPTYNRADVLTRAINSVLSQSIEDFELVIVDDGSTDGTESVISQYDDTRIRYFKHENNRGQNVARNTGLKKANGEYISYLDSDDEFLVPHLETVLNVLENLPNQYAGVITACEDYLEDRTRIKEVYDGKITIDRLLSGHLYEGISGLSVLTFRSNILEHIGLHDENIIKSTDLDFYIQILNKYYLYGINEPLCRRYKNKDSVSRSAEKVVNGEPRIIKKYGDHMSNFNLSQRRYKLAMGYSELGDLKSARREFLKCIIDYPLSPKYYYHFVLSFLGQRIFSRFSKYGVDLN